MQHNFIDEIHCNSKNKHIVLFSNYRTGSTVLGVAISNLTSLKFYPEVFLPNNINRFTQMWDSVNQGKKVIISIQGDQFTDYADHFLNHKLVLGNSYTIKLHRKNFINQLTSFYIANKIGKFSHYQEDSVIEYEVMIDYSLLNECFNHLLKSNRILSDLNKPFDLKLTYEDHITLLPSKLTSNFLKTPLPKNYVDLKNEILIFCNERLGKDLIFLKEA